MQSLSAPPSRRDPAPTRAQYRFQRLWLTPLFRVLFHVGLPAFVVTFIVGLYVADESRRLALGATVTEMRQTVERRPEFMITLISVEGASPDLAEAVRAMLGLALPLSSFDLDLAAARARVQSLDAVAGAELRVRSGGVLQVAITERQPVLIWRDGEAVEMLDATGHRVAGLEMRSDRPDLPLIAGDGAPAATTEAMDIIAAAGPILPRVRGLVRMGERRWDVVLDRNQRILLPTKDPVRALERMLALNQAEDILNRDILSVDLRNEHRPVLRLAPYALSVLRGTQGLDPAENAL